MTSKIFGKYQIQKANGESVDPDADYFVLRIDGSSPSGRAARAAVRIYAELIDAHHYENQQLAAEIRNRLSQYEQVKGGDR